MVDQQGSAGPGGLNDAEREDKVRLLQAAIDAYEPGQSGIGIDAEFEAALAPVKARAMHLINHRDRSAYELRSRLEALEFAPELVDHVVDLCVDSGLVDDARFAHAWVEQRSRNQKKSVSVLRQELRDKGVDHRIIEDALAQISPADQREVLDGLVAAKAAKVHKRPIDRKAYDKELRKIFGVAARRGFPESQALAAARHALDARIAELAEAS